MAILWATNLLHFHLNNLATYLATFQKIGRFFPNHLVTLQVISMAHISAQKWLKVVENTKIFLSSK
jgi:hypothetical protein